MRNCLVFPSYNFIYSYYSTYKDIFVSAFLLGYPIKDSLYTAPENIIQIKPIISYNIIYWHTPPKIINFYITTWFNIWWQFCASLSPSPENIVQDKPVTIFKNTPTYDSHIIIHFYIRQQLGTSLLLFENKLNTCLKKIQYSIKIFFNDFYWT